MSDRTYTNSQKQHLEMNKRAWDEYQAAFMEFVLKARPDYYEFFAAGGVEIDPLAIEMLGDIHGLKVLELSCAADATQAFSLANLGATVTACDISPRAIDIARKNAQRMGIEVEFVVADSQTLDPIKDHNFDIVFAEYNLCYYEDLPKACVNWYRVLRDSGRLFVQEFHPLVACLEERDGTLAIGRSYHDRTPEYYAFDGTPLAHRFGGWTSNLPAVEFFHSIADIVNAIVEASFAILRMVETKPKDERSSTKSSLPEEIAIVAVKAISRTEHVNETRKKGQ